MASVRAASASILLLLSTNFAHAQAPAAAPASASPVTEAFVKIGFNLPDGVLLGPSTTAQVILYATPAGGTKEEIITSAQVGGRNAAWEKIVKRYDIQPHLSKLNIPRDAKVRATIVCPVVISRDSSLGFVELSTKLGPMPKDTAGTLYLEDPNCKPTLIPPNVWQNNPALSAVVGRNTAMLFAFRTLPTGVRPSIGSGQKHSLTLAKGKGNDRDKLENLGTFEAAVLTSVNGPNPALVFYGKPIEIPADATSDIRVVSEFGVVDESKRRGTITGIGNLTPPTMGSGGSANAAAGAKPVSAAGKVVELKGREKWDK